MIVALDRIARVAMPAEPPVTDDIDLYRTAKVMLDRHDENAPIHASRQSSCIRQLRNPKI